MKSYKNKNNDKVDKKKSKNSDKNFDPAQASEQKIENPEKEKEEEIEKNKYFEKEYLKIREQVRYNPFNIPFEQLDKYKAYLQFLIINDYLMNDCKIQQPFEWLDENIEQKLIDAVKKADDDANLMSQFIYQKASFYDHHPETMPMYVSTLKYADYKWVLLNRLLLIYQKYKNEVDDETMASIYNLREQSLNGNENNFDNILKNFYNNIK